MTPPNAEQIARRFSHHYQSMNRALAPAWQTPHVPWEQIALHGREVMIETVMCLISEGTITPGIHHDHTEL